MEGEQTPEQSSYEAITGEGAAAARVQSMGRLVDAVPLFRDLPSDYRDLVASLVTPAHSEAGTVLVRQGEPAQELMMITEGSARVERDGEVVAQLGPGEFFGEIALLDGKPRSADVIAAGPIDLLVIQKPAFDHVMNSIPSLRERIVIVLCSRLRGLQGNLLD